MKIGYISSYELTDKHAWSGTITKAQSFFLWDNPSPTHQRRLMSMSFKKKYSSSG